MAVKNRHFKYLFSFANWILIYATICANVCYGIFHCKYCSQASIYVYTFFFACAHKFNAVNIFLPVNIQSCMLVFYCAFILCSHKYSFNIIPV